MSKATKFYNRDTGEMQWYANGALVTDPVVIAELELACLQDCVKPSVIECCTGGATAQTARCYNIPTSWMTGDRGDFDRCTWSIGGVDLPEDSYTAAQFQAAFPAGSTFEPAENPEQTKVCTAEGFTMCFRSACYRGLNVALGKACVVATINTEAEVCENFQRTWGKYEEPIANTLETILSTLEDMVSVQETVCFKSLCDAIVMDGRFTAAPDVLSDVTGFTLSGDDLAGAEVIFHEDLTSEWTWRELCEGRIEEIVSQNFPDYEYSCEELPNEELRIILKVCTDDLQGITINFRGGDATIDYSNEQIEIEREGVLCTNKNTAESVLISQGQIVTEYDLVNCSDEAECTCDLLKSLLTECPDACAESAVIGWCGRPANIADYAYGDIAEPSLPLFNAAWEAAGGKTWIAAEDGITGGECHWFCPAIPGATFTINGVEPGNGNVVVSPNPNAEALGCESTLALATLGCRDDAILEAVKSLVTQGELANAKLCIIENNTNTAAPCAEPVEGLDKEALTLTIAGDVVANYPEGQAINLQNANAESCGTATSAGGATFDGTVTVIPITECELDEGKEPVVIVKAQPVKAAVAVAIKTVKTLTAVRTLTKSTVIPVRQVTLNSFSAEAGSFVATDSVKLLSAERAVLGTATVTKVSQTSYGMEKNTVAEADLAKVAFAEKATVTKTAEKR